MDEEGPRRHPIERIYGPLGEYLATQAAAGERRVTLTFAAIEGAILGRPLPASARSPTRYHAWWHGGVPAAYRWHGWRRAGWTVAAVDLAAETVMFARPDGVGEGDDRVMARGETPGGYRTIRRPGPGLALVAEPNGRERLWARLRNARQTSVCANCGRPAIPGYRPSLASPGESRLYLCAACVLGDA